MNWRVGALVASALVCAAVLPASAGAQTACDHAPDPSRWVAAGTPDPAPAEGAFAVHRGGGTFAPEETIGAYSASVAYGADWIEGDIHETADGHYVLIHDDTIDHLTGTHDNTQVSSLTLAQLKALNVANYGDFALAAPPNPKQAYNPAQLMELGEALAYAGEMGVGMDLEIKQASDPAALARYAAQWPAYFDSFFEADPHEAVQMQDAVPRTEVMYNVAGGDGTPEEPAGTFYGLTQAPFNYGFFGSKLVKFPAEKMAEIHDGCAIALPHSYDAGNQNEAAQIKLGMARGVDGFQVNQADVAAAAMDQPAPTRIRFAGTDVCLENPANGQGFPYKTLSLGRKPPSVLTLRFGCVALPKQAPKHVTATFAGDGAALASSAQR